MTVSRIASRMVGLVRTVVALVRRNRMALAAILAALIFIAVLLDVRADDILHLDTAAYQLFVVRLRRSWLTPTMTRISDLSSPVILAVMLLAVEAFAPGRRPGLCAGANLVLVVALNTVLKHMVQRPRPDGFRLVAETGYSFPSGHAMVAAAFYGLLLWMVWRYERDRTVRILCVTGFAIVIVLIGISRIYLGVHYASDVIAGYCVSFAWLAAYTRIGVPLFLPTASAVPQAAPGDDLILGATLDAADIAAQSATAADDSPDQSHGET